MYLVEYLNPTFNYFNNTNIKIQKNNFCNIVNHNCNMLQKALTLIRFDRTCAVCVYDFKDSYISIFEEYKKQELLSLAIMKSELSCSACKKCN